METWIEKIPKYFYIIIEIFNLKLKYVIIINTKYNHTIKNYFGCDDLLKTFLILICSSFSSHLFWHISNSNFIG